MEGKSEIQIDAINKSLDRNYGSNEKVKNFFRAIEGIPIVDTNFEEMQQEVYGFLLEKKETSATELICNFIKKNENIFSIKEDDKREIWIYRDGIYVPNGESEIKEWCRKILGKGYTSHRINKIVDKIEVDTFIPKQEFFDTNITDEIPVLNGILNLRTRKLDNYTPKKRFFSKVPVIYNPEKKCPAIKKFIGEVLKHESDADVFYELCGYSLWKEYFIEQAIMFVGGGRNGKGKTQTLVKTFLGIENCSSLSLRSLNDESFDIEDLYCKHANIAGDISNTDLKETGLFKSLTGRDLIYAKRKFKSGLKFTNYAKLIFACNELPRVYDTSEGFWSRWVLLEFPNRFYKEEEYNKLPEQEKNKENVRLANPNIIQQLTSEDELSGLLNESLDALDRIRNNGGFSYTKGVKEVKEMWIRKADSFMAFCMDRIQRDDNSVITKRDLRKVYFAYCQTHKVSGSSDKSIKVTLQNLFGANDGQKTIENEREYVWEGIKWKLKF